MNLITMQSIISKQSPLDDMINQGPLCVPVMMYAKRSPMHMLKVPQSIRDYGNNKTVKLTSMH